MIRKPLFLLLAVLLLAVPASSFPTSEVVSDANSADPAAVVPSPGLPNGAQFLTYDPECDNWCFQDYLQCASGCSACDQCSCQLAYCRTSCGVPFTGC